MSKEGHVAACEVLKGLYDSGSAYTVTTAVKNAYREGHLCVVDEIAVDQDRVNVVFRVNDELFLIKLEYNSYNGIQLASSEIEGPLKATEKTVIVYE